MAAYGYGLSHYSGILRPVPGDFSESSWRSYNKKAILRDTAFVAGIKESMNFLLVFAGLFGATSTAFLIFTLSLLQPSSGDMTNQLLVTILNRMENSSYQAPSSPELTVPSNVVISNCLVSASVASTLLVAFFAILITQWANNFTDGLESIENEQLTARMRYFRFQGAEAWHLSDIAGALPVLLHISLVLFAGGAILFLFSINQTVTIVAIVALGAGALPYFALSIAPLLSKSAPFRSPLTTIVEYCTMKIPIILLSSLVSLQDYLRNLVQGHRAVKKTGDMPLDILGSEKALHRFVHTKRWDLDVSVLVHLMQSADRHTEREVLGTCLVDLQKLPKIEEAMPGLFDHNDILSVYFFLRRYCLTWKNGIPSVNDRDQSLKLCKFLAWIIEVSDRWPKKRKEAFQLRLQLTEASHLPHAAREQGESEGNIMLLIAGHLAGNTLQHLHAAQDPQCSCFDETRIGDFYLKLADMARPGQLEVGEYIIRYISCQTRCLVARPDGWNLPLHPWMERIAYIAHAFGLYDAEFIPIWKTLFTQYEGRSDLTPLAFTWINEIKRVVRLMLPRYRAATLSVMILGSLEPLDIYEEEEDNPPLDKWMGGGIYGPVLDVASAINLAVKLQINPILLHNPEPEDESRLAWDVLDSVKEARIMHGTEARKWEGGDANATFPRMRALTLYSNRLPVTIQVYGNGVGGAVTCADIINAIHEALKVPANHQFNEENRGKRAQVPMYDRNRSGEPGTRFKGRFKIRDFLEDYTSFDGLDDDEDLLRATLGLENMRMQVAVPPKEYGIPYEVELAEPLGVGHLVFNLKHRVGDVPVQMLEEPGSTEYLQSAATDSEDEWGTPHVGRRVRYL